MSDLAYIRSVIDRVGNKKVLCGNLYYELVYAHKLCFDILFDLKGDEPDYKFYTQYFKSLESMLESVICDDSVIHSDEYVDLLSYHDCCRDITELERVTGSLLTNSDTVSLLSIAMCGVVKVFDVNEVLFWSALIICGVVLLRSVVTKYYLSFSRIRCWFNRHKRLRRLFISSDVIIYCESRYNRKVRSLNMLAEALHRLQQKGLTKVDDFENLHNLAILLEHDDLSLLDYYRKLVEVEFIYNKLF